MSDAVMYLITGPSHLPNLAVSLKSLRRHWAGDVLVYAWPESYDIARQIADDPNICAQAVPCDAEYKRRNAQEIAKIRYINQIKDYGRIVYIDADTLIQKPLTELFESINTSPVKFVATQFCNWTMPCIAKVRVARLRGIPGIHQGSIELALQRGQPSYNSGIFSCSPSSPILPVWGDWTDKAKGVFISGESTLHAIAQLYPIRTLFRGVYNCSPQEKYQSPDLPDADVAIWHFHGDCNLRPTKSPRGVRMWWPHFQQALDENVGGMADWLEKIPNEFLLDLVNQSWQGW